MFENLRFSQKIMLILGITSILVILGIGSTTYIILKSDLEKRIEVEMKQINDSTYDMIETTMNTAIKNYLKGIAEKTLGFAQYNYNLYKTGIISEKEAYQRLKAYILSPYTVRIGKTGYNSAISGNNGVLEMHPRSEGFDASGFEVCRHLQKNEKTRKIPVIFISVSGDADDIVKGFTSGCRDYVKKDSSPQEILARIKTQLSLKQKNVELREINSELKKKQQEIKQKNSEIREKNSELNQKNNELKKSLEETDKQEKEIKKILYNILPSEVVEELKNHGEVKPYHYKKTSVLFTDFKDFSIKTKDLTPGQLITRLDEYFSAIDRIIEKWRLEKIKTIGDSYMCAGGLPRLNKSNPIQAVLAGLEIQRFIKDKNEQYEANNKESWKMRIGVHTGDIIAGVLGGSKYSYDIWGDTVNIASRMESVGEVGKVNISGVTHEDIKNYFLCTPRNKIKTKNIGELDMYFVEKIKPEYSEDDTGLEPNGKFLKIIDKLFHSKEI